MIDLPHGHAWTFAGRVDRDVAPGLGCESPVKLLCQCGGVEYARCESSRSSYCGACGKLYRSRVGRVARSGFRGGIDGVFMTLTAPGNAPHRFRKGGRLCPCTPPGGIDVARWNAGAGARFNRFMQALRRVYGADVEYFRSTEIQRRGAIHYHLLLHAGGRPLFMSESVVRKLAIKYGFGHEVDVSTALAHHSGYVAKYTAKAADQRPSVPWRGWRTKGGRWSTVDIHTGELTVHDIPRRKVRCYQATYRPWSASRGYGDRMSTVRLHQQHWILVVSRLPQWKTNEARPQWGAVDAPRASSFGGDDPPFLLGGLAGIPVLAGGVPGDVLGPDLL